MIRFNKGDLVTFRQEVSGRPNMIVKDIVKVAYRLPEEDAIYLLGIRCFWFSTTGAYFEQVFNTKDLIKL